MGNALPRDYGQLIEDWSHTNFAHLEWLAGNGRYISGEELAAAIETNPAVPFPDGLRSYVCRFLRGQIKQKRGPKTSEREFRFLVEYLATEEYRKELRRIQKERKGRGGMPRGKAEIPPHKEALQVIQRRFRSRFGSVTLRRIANIISSHN